MVGHGCFSNSWFIIGKVYKQIRSHKQIKELSSSSGSVLIHIETPERSVNVDRESPTGLKKTKTKIVEQNKFISSRPTAASDDIDSRQEANNRHQSLTWADKVKTSWLIIWYIQNRSCSIGRFESQTNRVVKHFFQQLDQLEPSRKHRYSNWWLVSLFIGLVRQNLIQTLAMFFSVFVLYLWF